MELKTIGLTKKFGSKTAERLEHHLDKWRLRFAGRKWRRKNNAYAATLQYSNAYFRQNPAEWQEHC